MERPHSKSCILQSGLMYLPKNRSMKFFCFSVNLMLCFCCNCSSIFLESTKEKTSFQSNKIKQAKQWESKREILLTNIDNRVAVAVIAIRDIEVGLIRKTGVAFKSVGAVVGIQGVDSMGAKEEIQFSPAKFRIGAEPQKQNGLLFRRKFKREFIFHFFKN